MKGNISEGNGGRMLPKALVGVMLWAAVCDAAGLTVIPVPNSIVKGEGAFPITRRTVIVCRGEGTREVGEYLSSELEPSRGSPFSVRRYARSNYIMLTTEGAALELGDEGYTLVSAPRSVTISANTAAGVFYGLQTLRQLLPPENYGRKRVDTSRWTVPAVKITDRPRFKWRGMHLDVCRHFFAKEFIKKYLDILAFHKMNTFHWHLTEDQGWRIEIMKYPKLTSVGAWREKAGFGFEEKASDADCFNEKGQYGGFYTQGDIREIVEYAKRRHITIVPEIELPGHSKAALKAYPELSCTGGPFEIPTSGGVYEDVYCAGKDKTLQFIEDVLGEVAELFPGEFVHVGGDECPKKRWKACADCQKRIRDEGLHDEHELQSFVIKHASKVLAAKGKRLIGWNEIIEGGLAKGAAVMSWTGEGPGVKAAKMGHDVVLTPNATNYFDHYQAKKDEPRCFGDYLPLKTVYTYDPMPKDLVGTGLEKHILGTQGNMWSERYENRRKAEYMLEPRGSAMAEITWSAKSDIDWEDFKRRLVVQFARMSALDIAYRSPAVIVSEDVRGTAVLSQEQKCGEIVYTLDGADPTPASPRYAEPISVTERTVLKACTLLPGGKLGRVKRAMLDLPKATVETSMPQNGFYEPLFAMDGFLETWFWSNRNANAGDLFTATLVKPTALKRVRAVTGGEGYHNDRVHKGVLEVAYEGADFRELATFDERGIAEVETRGVVRAVRIRLTASQQNWLIVREIDLAE